jgi:hypothetical protein
MGPGHARKYRNKSQVTNDLAYFCPITGDTKKFLNNDARTSYPYDIFGSAGSSCANNFGAYFYPSFMTAFD